MPAAAVDDHPVVRPPSPGQRVHRARVMSAGRGVAAGDVEVDVRRVRARQHVLQRRRRAGAARGRRRAPRRASVASTPNHCSLVSGSCQSWRRSGDLALLGVPGALEPLVGPGEDERRRRRPGRGSARSSSASIRIASCSVCAPWSRPSGPRWAEPSEDGTPTSVIISGIDVKWSPQRPHVRGVRVDPARRSRPAAPGSWRWKSG